HTGTASSALEYEHDRFAQKSNEGYTFLYLSVYIGVSRRRLMRENQQTLTGQPLTSAFRATAHGPLAINANRLITTWMGEWTRLVFAGITKRSSLARLAITRWRSPLLDPIIDCYQ